MSAMPSKEAVGSLGAGAVDHECDAVERSGGVVGCDKEADQLQGGEEFGVGGIAFVPLTGVRVFEIGVVAYVNSAKRAGCSRYIQDHLELKTAGPDHDSAQRHGEVGPTRAIHGEERQQVHLSDEGDAFNILRGKDSARRDHRGTVEGTIGGTLRGEGPRGVDVWGKTGCGVGVGGGGGDLGGFWRRGGCRLGCGWSRGSGCRGGSCGWLRIATTSCEDDSRQD